MGITGEWAFAAGAVLLAFRRHNPGLEADVIVFHDARLTEGDADLLRNLGARLTPFMLDQVGLAHGQPRWAGQKTPSA